MGEYAVGVFGARAGARSLVVLWMGREGADRQALPERVVAKSRGMWKKCEKMLSECDIGDKFLCLFVLENYDVMWTLIRLF